MSKVKFIEVCKLFDTLEGTSSRNEMTEELANFYKNINPQESQILSYLILGRVAPSFVESEFNYSEKSFLSLLEDLVKAKELDKEEVQDKRQELGDIGDTLEYFTEELGYKSKELILEDLYEKLWEIVNTRGTGSVEGKNKIIVDVLKKISPLEAKYFSRIICGSLRFGVSAKTLLDVFSVMVKGDKSMRDELDRAYGAYADIGYISSLVKAGKTSEVEKKIGEVKVQPGIPLLSRLVERVNTFEEVFERLGEEILVQPKYDGLRCQIHKFKKEDFSKKDSIWFEYIREESNGSLFETTENQYNIKLFTRNLEDVTDMFPEIVESARDIKRESFILDSEVLGWDTKEEKFLPFQDTMQRRRKYEVKDKQTDIPVKALVFDILYLNGKSLLQEDTEERINKLEGLNASKEERRRGGGDTVRGIQKTTTERVRNAKKLREIFDREVGKGYEGLIAKQKEGGYLPGTRNYEWIKLKKSMLRGLVDTIDLVVVGYNLGSGRRKELGVGSILGAAYNEVEDVFETVCNVGTGFTDEQLREIADTLKEDSVKEKPKNVVIGKDLEPDVWVDPKIVFTVEADEITKKKDSDSLSLRFPRLVMWDRDKNPIQATTVAELEGMYKKT
jgi:DNA ligase-1